MIEKLYEANEIDIKGNYDVIIVGAGIAGVAAALAARRNGCKVLLIEKSVIAGGLATLGLIVEYLPLCDGKGKKVIGGIAEELLHLSIKYGYDDFDCNWQNTGMRYRTVFSPVAFALAIDEILQNEGIDIMFDTVFSKPVIEKNECKGVIVENKSGRSCYLGKVIVDASGDADVAFRAGIECIEKESLLSSWALYTSLDKMKKAVESKDIGYGIGYDILGWDPEGYTFRNTEESNKDKVVRKAYYGTRANDVSEFMLESRKILLNNIKNRSKKEFTYTIIPGMALMRTTRRIKGVYELKKDDVFKTFEDSIGCTGDWRIPGPVFEIPYRCIISQSFKNIIVAGRIISAVGDAWEITRVIPAAALTGQAAGTAAAISIKTNKSLQDIDVSKLQDCLKNAGVFIHT